MSVNYLAAPVDDSFLEYARSNDYKLPSVINHGRWPDLDELRQSMASFPEHELTIRGDETLFSITTESLRRIPFESDLDTAKIDAPESYLNVQGFLTGKPRPLISFHGDYDLVVSVVQKLAERCGPQYFFIDWEGVPYLVADGQSDPVGPAVSDEPTA